VPEKKINKSANGGFHIMKSAEEKCSPASDLSHRSWNQEEEGDVVIGSEVAIPMSRAKCEEVDWPEVPDGACLAIIS